MLQLIQPVTELLNHNYAAVGILEHWDASIRLFQRALQLPDYNWAQVFFFTHCRRHPFVVLMFSRKRYEERASVCLQSAVWRARLKGR